MRIIFEYRLQLAICFVNLHQTNLSLCSEAGVLGKAIGMPDEGHVPVSLFYFLEGGTRF